MNDQQLLILKEPVTGFMTETADILSWKWDERMYGVLAEFQTDISDRIISLLNHFFGVQWHIENIAKAPQIVHMISDSTGGLRPGQKIFVTDPNQNPLVFCAYWPWGNGKTISLRVVPTGLDLTKTEMTTIVSTFREWTGV